MRKITHDIILRAAKLLDVMLMTFPFAIAWYLYYADRTIAPFYSRGNWLVIALFAGMYIVCNNIYDGFLVSVNRISEMIYSQALALIVSDGAMYLIIWLLTKFVPSPLPLFQAFLVQVVLAALWSFCAHNWYFRVFRPRRSAVIFDERTGVEELIKNYGLNKKFKIVASLNISEFMLNDYSSLEGIETVFASGIRSHMRNKLLKYCVENNIDMYVLPSVGDIIMSGARPVHMLHLPILRVGKYNPAPEYLAVKRLFDIVCSLAALIVLSPLMLIIAVAIKAYDGGSVFYRQERLTKDNRRFNVLKFRSMVENAEQDGKARLSTGENDDRITPVGRIIRKLRLDELPQLINILTGSMSLVGPRPERPEIAEQYEKTLPEFRLRLQAKAGLTGYAQVYGKYNTTPYDKLQMDLMYMAHPGIIEDLRILFATVKILFMPESTEGVDEGQTTAEK